MSERYPCHYSSTALMCLMGSLQTVSCALCVENNRWSEWKLGWNIRLLAVSYSVCLIFSSTLIAGNWNKMVIQFIVHIITNHRIMQFPSFTLSLFLQGTVASGIMITVTMWCVRMRGPLFVSVFSPLMLILVAIAGSLFLDEKLHLGR